MSKTTNEIRLLLDLIPFLRRHRGYTDDELAQLLNCTKDEVNELIDRILMCGVPPYSPRDYVSVFRDAKGRIWAEFADHFRRPVQFSPTELACLKLMLKDPLLDHGDDTIRDAQRQLREKLDAICPPASGDETGLPIHIARPGTLAQQHFQVMKSAIENQRRLRIRHFSSTRFQLAEREVDPLRLVREGDLLYLIGFDHTFRRQILRFRVDRIESVTELDVPMAPVDKAELEAVLDAGMKPGKDRETEWFVAHFSARVAPYLREGFGRKAITAHPDGSITLRVPLANENWLLRFVLAYGDDAEIVEPARMRDHLRHLVERLLNDLDDAAD